LELSGEKGRGGKKDGDGMAREPNPQINLFSLILTSLHFENDSGGEKKKGGERGGEGKEEIRRSSKPSTAAMPSENIYLEFPGPRDRPCDPVEIYNDIAEGKKKRGGERKEKRFLSKTFPPIPVAHGRFRSSYISLPFLQRVVSTTWDSRVPVFQRGRRKGREGGGGERREEGANLRHIEFSAALVVTYAECHFEISRRFG